MMETPKGKGSSLTYQYDGEVRKDAHGHGKAGHRAILRFVKLLDVLAVCTPFTIALIHYYSRLIWVPDFRMRDFLIVLLYYCIYYLTTHLYSGFLVHIKKISEIIYAQSLAAVITNFLIYIIIWILMARLPNIPVMLLVLAAQEGLIVLWAYLSHRWYFHTYPARSTIIIYDEMDGVDRLIHQYGMEAHFRVTRAVSSRDILDGATTKQEEQARIHEVLQGTETAFLCGLHSHARNQILKYCVAYDITAYVLPRIGDIILSGAERMPLFHEPMLQVGRYDPKPEYLFFKRFFDILLSSIAIVILSPLMIVLSLIIRSDGGTAFYRQKRLTQNGRVFEMLKFRSMCMNAEKDGVARLSTGEADPRITKVGRFIRACRMDELPQLFNILKGDMSIVGPRPERPEIAAQYKETLPEFDLRLQCRCGLTGYAQVYGQYNTTPYDKLLMDLMYISKPSLAEDFKICLATVRILFMKESTKGIAEGQTTAEVRMKKETVNAFQDTTK